MSPEALLYSYTDSIQEFYNMRKVLTYRMPLVIYSASYVFNIIASGPQKVESGTIKVICYYYYSTLSGSFFAAPESYHVLLPKAIKIGTRQFLKILFTAYSSLLELPNFPEKVLLSKGFPFCGVTLTYANSAQLAGWAKFKNVQNLHKSKNKPFSYINGDFLNLNLLPIRKLSQLEDNWQ